VYVERDEDDALVGSCLIGCALIDAGVTPEALDVGEFGIGALVKEGVLSLPPNVLGWAAEIQMNQDIGFQWGRAVDIADTIVGLGK
jgi:hypothetical protein